MNYIFGIHPVKDAFNNSPSSIQKVFLKKSLGKKILDDFIELAKKHKTVYVLVDDNELSKMVSGNHQGVVVIQNEVALQDIDSFLDSIKNKDGVIVLMHEMNDPHNVGAIIRSAAAFGALGVIVPTRNQSPITETVVRVSSGGVSVVPIIKIVNINNAILKLQKNGFWIYGLTEKGSDSIYKTNFDKKSVIIIGNEHSGIDAMALKKCDFKIKIPINDNVDSLNASVSASIALYEWNRNQY